MAFSEFEIKRIEKLMGAFIDKHRPPAEVRQQLDVAYRLKGQSIEIFEVRPMWRGEPGEVIENAASMAHLLAAC